MSSLEAARYKLANPPEGKVPYPEIDLPEDAASVLWTSIVTEYNLYIHEAAALQNFVKSRNPRQDAPPAYMIPFLEETARMRRKRLMPWTPSHVTRSEQPEFKEKLIDFYKANVSESDNQIRCLVLNCGFPRNVVRAAHIWKLSTHGDGLSDFDLEYSDINDARNGLLLHESIEKAFNTLDLCFLYDPFARVFCVKVLQPPLLKKYVVEGRQRFSDIDGSILHLPDNVFPFRRLLSWHARCAHYHAFMMRWIDEAAWNDFQPYIDLSNASEPSDVEF